MKATFLSLTAALSLGAVATAGTDGQCSASSAQSFAQQKNVVETALAAGSFKTLAGALSAAGLVETLSGPGPFTVFAPTDAAFAALPAGTLASLTKPENKGALTNVLTYHVVAGRVNATQVTKLPYATALNGQRIPISTDDDGVQVAGVRVVKTDIECTNGVIHVIDAVLMPKTQDLVETAVAAKSFKTLAAALQAAGLVEALQGEGPLTVFAPTDEAFAALPEGTVESLLQPENKQKLIAILKYHVVAGRVYADQLSSGPVPTLQGSPLRLKLEQGKVLVNESRVSTADVEATNGVIHVIDRVLMPE